MRQNIIGSIIIFPLYRYGIIVLTKFTGSKRPVVLNMSFEKHSFVQYTKIMELNTKEDRFNV